MRLIVVGVIVLALKLDDRASGAYDFPQTEKYKKGLEPLRIIMLQNHRSDCRRIGTAKN